MMGQPRPNVFIFAANLTCWQANLYKYDDLNYELRYLRDQISIPCIWFVHSV